MLQMTLRPPVGGRLVRTKRSYRTSDLSPGIFYPRDVPPGHLNNNWVSYANILPNPMSNKTFDIFILQIVTLLIYDSDVKYCLPNLFFFVRIKPNHRLL